MLTQEDSRPRASMSSQRGLGGGAGGVLARVGGVIVEAFLFFLRLLEAQRFAQNAGQLVEACAWGLGQASGLKSQ